LDDKNKCYFRKVYKIQWGKFTIFKLLDLITDDKKKLGSAIIGLLDST